MQMRAIECSLESSRRDIQNTSKIQHVYYSERLRYPEVSEGESLQSRRKNNQKAPGDVAFILELTYTAFIR